MVVRAVRRLARLGLDFARDRRGSNTVEFVISVPILLAVLVLSTEYGKILHKRTVLDSAVADATRYLTRVPFVDPEQETPVFPSSAVAYAENIIAARVESDDGDISVVVEPYVVEDLAVSGGNEITIVTMRASAVIPSPALSVLNIARPNTTTVNGRDVSRGITIESRETYRHFGN